MSEIKSYVQLARTVTLFSFVGSSTIFAVHFFWSCRVMLVIGFVYILAMAMVNLSVIIVVAAAAWRTRNRSVIAGLLLLLLNVPVMMLYVWLAIGAKNELLLRGI
jgi:hypothetical protein